jgi:hypothetical protein
MPASVIATRGGWDSQRRRKMEMGKGRKEKACREGMLESYPCRGLTSPLSLSLLSSTPWRLPRVCMYSTVLYSAVHPPPPQISGRGPLVVKRLVSFLPWCMAPFSPLTSPHQPMSYLPAFPLLSRPALVSYHRRLGLGRPVNTFFTYTPQLEILPSLATYIHGTPPPTTTATKRFNGFTCLC